MADCPDDRFERGVFYTPMEIARYQIREVSRLLREQFGLDGLLDPSVVFLDPACGTGNYLLALAEVAAEEATAKLSPGDNLLRDLFARRTVGFEISAGPASIAQARLATWLRSPPRNMMRNCQLRIHTVDTLSHHAAELLEQAFNLNCEAVDDGPVVRQRVGATDPVLVVVGNPPWGRRAREHFDQATVTESGIAQNALSDWARGAAGAAQSVYDLYVAFWRFACKALLERSAARPSRGIISFVTNRSWIRGRPFSTVRSYMRNRHVVAHITDLGGDARAGKLASDQGVFAIKAGSAIATLTFGTANGTPMTHYRRLVGSRAHKLRQLEDSPEWCSVLTRAAEPFAPSDWGILEGAPSVLDFFASSMPGVKTHRDELVVGLDEHELIAKLNAWNSLPPNTRAARFHVSRGRDVPAQHRVSAANVKSYRYRPLDTRVLYADRVFIQEPGRITKLYHGHPNARCLQFLKSGTVSGPVVIGANQLPDYHSVRGSFGSQVVMIDEVAAASHGALSASEFDGPRLLSEWAQRWADSMRVSVEQVGCYLLALGNAPTYVELFGDAVKSAPPRMPVTVDERVLMDAIALGRRLLLAWTLGMETDAKWRRNSSPRTELGKARIEGTSVTFASGDQLIGVHPEVGAFEVSGYPVFRRYLEARSHCILSGALSTDIRRVAGSLAAILDARTASDDLLARALEAPTFGLVRQ